MHLYASQCKFHMVCTSQQAKIWCQISVQAGSTVWSALISVASKKYFCEIWYNFAINQLQTIHSLNLGKKFWELTASLQSPPPNECPGYDTKQSDGEVPVTLELLGMWHTPILPPGPLWRGVVEPDKGPSYGSHWTKPWFREFNVFCI